MTQLLETVVTLQKTLDQLSDLEQRLSSVPEEMRELHEAYTTQKAEIDALQETIREAGEERRAAEAASQDCNEKLKHYQEQVNRVRTQREYSAILTEIDLVRDQSRAFEEQALAAMERQDEAESELAEKNVAFEDIDVQYQLETEKWEEAKPGVAAEADQLRGTRDQLREAIPGGSLILYEQIYTFTDGHAMAPVHPVSRGVRGPSMWHCGACHYNVRPQAVVEITHSGSLIQCDGCKRFLYAEDAAV